MTYKLHFTDRPGSKVRYRQALKLMGAENIRIEEKDEQETEKPKKDNVPTSPEARLMADLYGRPHDREWSDQEIAAFRKAIKRGVITTESMTILTAHYKQERKKADHYCRRDLLTCLRNIDGEIDRAKAAKPKSGKSLEWVDSTPKLTVLPDPAHEERIRAAAREQAEQFKKQQRA